MSILVSTERLRLELTASQGRMKVAAAAIGVSNRTMTSLVKRRGLDWKQFRPEMCSCKSMGECEVCKRRLRRNYEQRKRWSKGLRFSSRVSA